MTLEDHPHCGWLMSSTHHPELLVQFTTLAWQVGARGDSRSPEDNKKFWELMDLCLKCHRPSCFGFTESNRPTLSCSPIRPISTRHHKAPGIHASLWLLLGSWCGKGEVSIKEKETPNHKLLLPSAGAIFLPPPPKKKLSYFPACFVATCCFVCFNYFLGKQVDNQVPPRCDLALERLDSSAALRLCKCFFSGRSARILK